MPQLLSPFKTFFCLVLTAASLCFGITAAHAEPKAFDYIVPEADTRYYSETEIADMDLQVVCYAKNEIYARHGRRFRSAELSGYFNEQPWYIGSIDPDQFSDSVFNSYEVQNIQLLNDREQAIYSGGYLLDQPGYSYSVVYHYIASQNGITALESTTHSVIPGTDRASTYLRILQDNQQDILSYNWQAYPNMEVYPNPDTKAAALFDLNGDGTDELLFITAPTNEYGYSYTGILHIYTWEGSQAREIYHSSDYIDLAVGGGCYYVVYQNLATGGLSIFTSSGDESWTDTLTEYLIGEDGTYEAAVILEDYSYLDYDNPDYERIHDYYRNQDVTSYEYYEEELQNSWAGRGAVLFWSDYGMVSSALGTLPDMIAMTYYEAVSYLSELASAVQDDSLSPSYQEAYYRFLSENQFLFTQQEQSFWYGTYDIDRDDIPELFVKYPAGVRQALQIFSYSDGQVMNILPIDEYYGDQALYAAEEILTNGYDNSICIGSSGGAAYHYNTTYIKQDNALYEQYTLLRDYTENTCTRDDMPISEAEYDSLLDSYYEAQIEFYAYY